jgi:uncharacterized protein YjbJ (UPF0337 family)
MRVRTETLLGTRDNIGLGTLLLSGVGVRDADRQMRRMKVNTDILEGKWKQIRGHAKQRWGKLTDSDLDKANGKADELAGLLQEKYGYTTEKAHEEIASFMKEHEKK